MNLDASYIGPYLEEWLKHILDSSNKQQENILKGKIEFYPYSGASSKAIKSLFAISTRAKQDQNVKYLAVHIFDKFMFLQFRELLEIRDSSEQSLTQIRKTMSNKLKLTLVASLQLASKMFENPLGVEHVKELLKYMDCTREYSRSLIVSSEIKILKSINFKTMICTPIQVVEILLSAIKLRNEPRFFDTCVKLLDLAYIRHEEIFQQLHLIARGKPFVKHDPKNNSFIALESNILYISAAVIVCSTYFLNLKRNSIESIQSKLSKLIDIDGVDITILANIIFNFVL